MSDEQFSEQDFIVWTTVLEGYARDWDSTFENKPNYFTQEYWYLFIGCLRSHWKGAPLTISEACQIMKSGSNRTREERIRKAVVDGYLLKQKHPEDGRETLLVPSDKLVSIVVDHLKRTLLATKMALDVIESNVNKTD